jgi:hypothetical protein
MNIKGGRLLRLLYQLCPRIRPQLSLSTSAISAEDHNLGIITYVNPKQYLSVQHMYVPRLPILKMLHLFDKLFSNTDFVIILF